MIFDFKFRSSTTQLTLTTHLQQSTTPCPQETRGARCYTLGVCGVGSQYILPWNDHRRKTLFYYWPELLEVIYANI